ncbi:unknown_gene_10591 [Phodopus roborovskii]|uniref:Unknown_gene_10591 protein n=1 Tax=Phodopus roborovskii TaxID=109678 RepID=A0AAU9ZWH9_PHORO|nr:unknown_gene_10591 [Phodopus roborovskii]
MQLNPLSQDTWRHVHHGAYPTPIERESPLTLQESNISHLYYILSPGDRRSYLLDDSPSSTQRESLAIPMGHEDSAPGVQQKQQQLGAALLKLEGEEIAPTDVKYRLQQLEEAPLQRKSSSGHNQHNKPGWNLFSKPHREWFKPEDQSSKSSSAPYIILPGHIQGRRTAPRRHLSHVEYVSQDQNNTQAPVWHQVLSSGLDKSSQGIIQPTQRVSREMAPGWPRIHGHQDLSQTKQGIAIMGKKSPAKFDEATTSRASYLPPLKLLSRRVKSKWPPHTPGIFQAKFQTELTSKHFFQDWRAQPQGLYGSNKKPQDQVNTRLTYMPLFTGKVKLYKPQTNGIRQETNTLSTERGKSLSQVSARILVSKREHVEKETA